jgi:ribosome-binding factor A
LKLGGKVPPDSAARLSAQRSTSVKNRLDRVNELLKRELSDLVRREITFKAKLVTIQQVDVTPDLKHAHVFVGVIGTQEEQKHALNELHDHRQRLQNELSKRVVIKWTPQLHFKLDTAGERGDRILNILDQLGLPQPPTPEHADDDEAPNHDR